ncbi:hypothetical protein CJF32_00005195 [Rutstroemia sp. NJR-2017a WRK4]|nr:hypothetical protein CJF32_00005195 [Rutstroemia sp. NJR-2017a WRK4]
MNDPYNLHDTSKNPYIADSELKKSNLTADIPPEDLLISLAEGEVPLAYQHSVPKTTAAKSPANHIQKEITPVPDSKVTEKSRQTTGDKKIPSKRTYKENVLENQAPCHQHRARPCSIKDLSKPPGVGDNTTPEDHAENTQTVPKQEGWIADRLKPNRHKFKIGNDTWLLSKGPITAATYDTFSRAVYECKRERDGKDAIVKIWMHWVRTALEEDPSNPGSDYGNDLDDWDDELKCLGILKERYNDLKEKEGVPSKPFPDAIELSKLEQEKNFPVPGGKQP